jgi:hypothetical protein
MLIYRLEEKNKVDAKENRCYLCYSRINIFFIYESKIFAKKGQNRKVKVRY